MREHNATVGRWIGAGAGIILLLGQVYRCRPYSLERPATPIANTKAVVADFRRLTQFLVELEPAIPRGATVSLLSSGARTEFEDYLNFLVALGQWPRASVLFPSFRWPKTSAPASRPDYVAAFEEDFSDPRYRLVFRGRLGTLYRKRS